MAGLFSIVEDVVCILQSDGLYKQVDVYRRGNGLYAKHGAGFVGLRDKGGTTKPKLRWMELVSTGSEEFSYSVGKVGALEVVE